MINLKVTQAQWDCAIQELEHENGASLELEQDGTYNFVSNVIDATLKYGNGILLVTVTQKHGIAKFASEAAIQHHLVDMLGALQCSSTPAPAVN